MKKYKLVKIYPKSAPLDTCVVFYGLVYVNDVKTIFNITEKGSTYPEKLKKLVKTKIK